MRRTLFATVAVVAVLIVVTGHRLPATPADDPKPVKTVRQELDELHARCEKLSVRCEALQTEADKFRKELDETKKLATLVPDLRTKLDTRSRVAWVTKLVEFKGNQVNQVQKFSINFDDFGKGAKVKSAVVTLRSFDLNDTKGEDHHIKRVAASAEVIGIDPKKAVVEVSCVMIGHDDNGNKLGGPMQVLVIAELE